MFERCTNGCIPNLKLQNAFKASHNTQPIFFHNQQLDDWAVDASSAVRQVARSYRMVKESPEQQETTLKKALEMNLL